MEVTDRDEGPVTKSRSDLKSYKFLNLESGLEVLLVDSSKLAKSRNSSPDAKETSHKAAAAMFVSVGSFADPAQAEGCAHFLEHMIFMGVDSPKYPNSENLYDSFVSSHGGSCNAFTEGEYTVYQFDITDEHFPAALDIFACCFKSPLLAINSSDREIKSIESEFRLAQVSDGTRLQQLMFDSATNGHVLRKFSWGNMNSLSTIPKAENIDVHSILKSFYKKHYVPAAMKLVVLAPRSLEELEKEVMGSFGDWSVLPTPPAEKDTDIDSKGKRKRKNKDKAVGPAALELRSLEESIAPFRSVSPFPTEERTYITRVIPHKKTHKLIMTWYLPPCVADYKTKPGNYISHLLGHEGPGSLLSALKSCGLATGVSAGISTGNMESNSMFSLFAVTVYLTTKGLSNWVQVTGRVFEYIALLRAEGPQERIQEEIRKIAEVDFGFLDEEEESDFVERLCVEMAPSHARERKDLLTAGFLYWSWDPAAVSASLSLMTPALCRLELLSSAFVFKDEAAEKEKKAGLKGKGKAIAEESDDDEDEDDDDEDSDDNDNDDDDDDDDDEDDSDDSEDDDDEEGGRDGGDDAAKEDLSPSRIEALYSGSSDWKKLCRLPVTEGPGAVEPSKEPHFGTLYWKDPLPRKLIAQWAAVKPSKDLHLPPPNRFIPDDLALVDDLQKLVDSGEKGEKLGDAKQTEAVSVGPAKIAEEDGLHVWHLLDSRFPVPKVQICCQFLSLVPQTTAHCAAFHELFVKLLSDHLTETAYMAAMAELHCDIISTASSIVLKVSGFSDKACLLVETVAQTLFNPSTYLTEDAVERQRELLQRAYSNANMKASEAASTSRLLALAPMRHSSDSKLKALLAVQESSQTEEAPKMKGSKSAKGTIAPKSPMLQSVSEYTTAFLRSLCGECLVHGNISAHRASALSDKLKDIAITYARDNSQSPPLSDNNIPHQQVVLLPLDKAMVVCVAPKNPAESNKCVEAYFQLGPYNIQHLTALELLEQCLSEPFFDKLRTQQQLGYSVSCGVRQTYGMLGFCFQVVSSSHSIEDIQNAIFSFVDSIPALLHLMPVSDFQNHLNSQISEKQRPDPSLYDAAGFNWYEITEGKIDFNLRGSQVEYLKDDAAVDIKQAGLKAFSERLLVSSRRLLLVQASVESGKQGAPVPLPDAFSASFGRQQVKAVVVRSVSEVLDHGTVTVPR